MFNWGPAPTATRLSPPWAWWPGDAVRQPAPHRLRPGPPAGVRLQLYGARLYRRVKESYWFRVNLPLGFCWPLRPLAPLPFCPHVIGVFGTIHRGGLTATTALRLQCLTHLCVNSWVVMGEHGAPGGQPHCPAIALAMSLAEGISSIPAVLIFPAFWECWACSWPSRCPDVPCRRSLPPS